MVGDNWEWDIANAARAGIKGFWIAASGTDRGSSDVEAVGSGSLDAFLLAAESGDLERSIEWSRTSRAAR